MTDKSMESRGANQTSPEGENIDQVAHKAFDEAQANGLEPQEAFDAAAGAIIEIGVKAGIPSEEIEAGINAASEAFQQNMNEGGDPVTAFDSAMHAGEEAVGDMPPPDAVPTGEEINPATAFDSAIQDGDGLRHDGVVESAGDSASVISPSPDQEDAPRSETVGRMAEGGDPATAYDSAIQANEVPMPDSGAGDMLDAAISSVGSEPPTGESSEPRGADLALEQAVRRGEGNKTEKESETEDEDGTMDIDVEILEVLPADYADEAADS